MKSDADESSLTDPAPYIEELRQLREAAADRQYELTELEIERHIRRVELTDRLTGTIGDDGKQISATKAAEKASVHEEITVFNHQIASKARELAIAEAVAERTRLYLDRNATPPGAGPA